MFHQARKDLDLEIQFFEALKEKNLTGLTQKVRENQSLRAKRSNPVGI